VCTGDVGRLNLSDARGEFPKAVDLESRTARYALIGGLSPNAPNTPLVQAQRKALFTRPAPQPPIALVRNGKEFKVNGDQSTVKAGTALYCCGVILEVDNMQGKTYGEVSVGETYAEAVRITDAHLSLGAALIGDFNPLHVDEAFAQGSRHHGRILHGVITSAIIGAPAGMLALPGGCAVQLQGQGGRALRL
jgi:hypothetical protein